MCNITKKKESTLRHLERVCAGEYTCPYLLESVKCLKCNAKFIVFKTLLYSVTYILVVIWRKIANCKNPLNGQRCSYSLLFRQFIECFLINDIDYILDVTVVLDIKHNCRLHVYYQQQYEYELYYIFVSGWIIIFE